MRLKFCLTPFCGNSGIGYSTSQIIALPSCDPVHDFEIISLRKLIANLLMEIERISQTGAVMAIGEKEGPIPGRTPGEGAVHTVSAREIVRGRLESDVEKFLAKGGVIESVSQFARSESMDNSENTYSSRPE